MHKALRFSRLGMPYRLSVEVAKGIDENDGTEALERADEALHQAEAVKLPPYTPFNTRAQASSAAIPFPVQQISVRGIRYIRDQDGTALETDGGAMWSPLPDNGGSVPLEAWGVVYGARSAAASNGQAINRALVWAAANRLILDLGVGTIFCSQQLTVPAMSYVRGGGAIGEWSKLNTISQGRAACTIVFTGIGEKTETVFGVSSQYNWGAGRINPSSRIATHNDAEYRLLSFVEDNPNAAGRSLKPFSAAVKCEGSGTVLENFRILPDYGGPDGMQGYTEEYNTVVGNTGYPLSDGDWDVGLYQVTTVNTLQNRFQAVGQWRMAGLLAIAHSKGNPSGYYKNYFQDCTFNGYHGVEIRSADGAPVVATTTSTVDIPWADDHPFGADGDNRVFLNPRRWPSNKDTHTFTGMEKVTGGPYPILRLTGVTPAVPAGTAHAHPYHFGGGTSHTEFHRGEIQGFHHPSRQPAHIKGLGGIPEGAFQYPSCCIGISGTKATEITFRDCSVSSVEEVAIHIHDCRHVLFDFMLEMNRGAAGQSSRGGRVILSPAPTQNTHSLAGFACAGSREIVWIHRGSSTADGSIDTRPSLPFINSTDFIGAGDNGFMESYYLHAPLDGGLNGNLSEGQALIAPEDRRAGIGGRNGPPSFAVPNEDGIDWALFYSDLDDNLQVRKNLNVGHRGLVTQNPGFDGVNGLTVNVGSYISASRNSVTGYWNRNTAGIMHRFGHGAGTFVGSISVDETSTSFNTSSDYRLKNAEDVPEDWNAESMLDALAGRLRWYSWKSDPSRLDLGWFAHELAEVAPNAVNGVKDAVDDEGRPEYQGRDDSKLIPVIVAALKSALDRIRVLEGEK